MADNKKKKKKTGCVTIVVVSVGITAAGVVSI